MSPIEEMDIYCLHIPFRQAFSHAAHNREASDSVVVRIRSEDGTRGYGECLPRPYVTGETVSSVVQYLTERVWPTLRGARPPEPKSLLPELPGSHDTQPSPGERTSGIRAHNAALCGAELAWIDNSLRQAGRPLADALPVRTPSLKYSAVVGAGDQQATESLCDKIAALGIHDVKVKVGDAGEVERVRMVRARLGSKASLRVDANGAWPGSEARSRLVALAEFSLSCCEEPFSHSDPDAIERLALSTGVPILLDETLVTIDDARRYERLGENVLFDLRLSKCGGLGRSSAIAHLARQSGCGIVVGCQVGETAILSAAGRHFAAHFSEHKHLEGSFGTMLLERDLTDPSLQFGGGGEAGPLEGPGLGIDVIDHRLDELADKKACLR